MFSDAEASSLRQRFWTRFGQYMSPIPSASAEKVNWINYRTGVKNIRWKMESLNREASVAVLITGDDSKNQEFLNVFQQSGFIETNNFEIIIDEEQGILKLEKQLTGISVLNESQWPELISFFKENSLTFDNFWSENKFIFEMNL